MPLRSAHGRARELGRTVVVETSPPDELAVGVAASPPTAPPGYAQRLRAGALTADDQRWAQARGAAKRAAVRELVRLGLPEGSGGALAPYLRDAERWAVAECQRLAKHVGGGQCPPNVAALVRSAALAMAGGAAAFAAGDTALGCRCTAEQRANTLAAHELAAREAKARAASAPQEPW